MTHSQLREFLMFGEGYSSATHRQPSDASGHRLAKNFFSASRVHGTARAMPQGRELPRRGGFQHVRARQQMQDRRPASQRLAYSLHQRQMLRTRQNIPAGIAPRVHLALNVGKQPRRVLDLIQYDRPGKRFQKSPGVIFRRLPHIQLFQGAIGMLRKNRANQSRFPGLTWPRERHHRKFVGLGFQRGRKKTRDHSLCRNAFRLHICKLR